MNTCTFAFIGNLFRGPDLIILLGVGLLIFGKRLPEVGRGLGRSIVEFRKGLKGVHDEIDDSVVKPTSVSAMINPDALPPLSTNGGGTR